MTEVEGDVEQTVNVHEEERRGREGTMVGEATGEGHAREAPMVSVVKKGSILLKKITGVAP